MTLRTYFFTLPVSVLALLSLEPGAPVAQIKAIAIKPTVAMEPIVIFKVAAKPVKSAHPTPIPYVPGASSKFRMQLNVAAGVPGPITFYAKGLPPGVTASFEPATAKVPAGGGEVSTLVTLKGGASTAMPTTATFHAGISLELASLISIILQPVRIIVSATHASPAQTLTPRLLRPGTTVTITGSGFHAGAQVKFGNADAVVNAGPIDPQGTSLSALVPALATTGQPAVLQDGATYPAPETLVVDNWRNVNGYSFCNTGQFQSMVGGWTFNDLTEVFGFDQTHNNILGWRPEDPLAWVFLGIANSALNSGQCFGFTVSSLRLQTGQRRLSDFPSWNGTDPNVPGATRDVWHLRGPQMSNGTNASTLLSHFVHMTHIQQFSAEFLGSWIAHWNISGNKDVFHAQVRAALSEGHAGIVTVNGGGCNHVVQVYNLEDHPDGSFDVWIYDPNVPFLPGEADGSRTRASRISVSASGNYVFNDGAGENCSGGLSALRALPLSAAPPNPHLPTIQGAISAIGHLFGDAAQVTQVTDAAGKKLLARDGTANTDQGSRIPGSAVFVPLGGLRGKQGAPLYLLAGKGPHQYTITGKSGGTYSLQTVGNGFAVNLENTAVSGALRDEVTIDHGAGSVQFKTMAPSKQVTLHLHARAADGQMRTAVLATTGYANAPVHLAFDAQRESVVYRHEGQPVTFTLKMSAPGQGSKMETLQTAPATIEKGDQITFKPNWRLLGAGGTMQVQKLGGAIQQKQIK